tara:strand:+ start:1622 stop:2230 length:609 start_codon:yes stop_codon:yes gene_type:complete
MKRTLIDDVSCAVFQKSGMQWHKCAIVESVCQLRGGRGFRVCGVHHAGMSIVSAQAALPHAQMYRDELAMRGAITDGMLNATAFTLHVSKSSPGDGSTYTIKTTWGSRGTAPCGYFVMSNGLLLNVLRPTASEDLAAANDDADAAIEAASQMHYADEDIDHAYLSATVAASSDALVSVPIADLARLRKSADTLVKCIDTLLE